MSRAAQSLRGYKNVKKNAQMTVSRGASLLSCAASLAGRYRCSEELPEKCLGVIRLINLDLDGAKPLGLDQSKPLDDLNSTTSPHTASPPSDERSPLVQGEGPLVHGGGGRGTR